MGSQDRTASPRHRRCGLMQRPILSPPTAPMHPRRLAAALPMHRWCIGDALRYPDPTDAIDSHKG
eukprot:5309558-Pyramimonas_sp.AAC.1